MAGFVKVSLIGNLGRDPEVRFSPGGVAVCNLSVACTERVKAHGGDYEDKTEWVRVVCFGKTAEAAGQYLQKGKQVFAEGRLQTQEWTDKDGNKRTSTEVVCNQLVFIGGGAGGDTQKKKPTTQPAPAPALADDDIPF